MFIAVIILFLWCCLVVSSYTDNITEKQQNKEDKYHNLDPKSLDDDILIDKFMEENIFRYEEENREMEDNSRK